MSLLPNLFKIYYGKLVFACGAISMVIIGLSACQETDGGPLGPSSLNTVSANVTVSPGSVTLAKGDTLTFSAIGGTNSFTWTVSDTTVATIVSNTGLLTAQNISSAVTVTATDANGATGTATVFVSDKALSITPRIATVGRSQQEVFTVTGVPTVTGDVFFTVTDADLGSFGAANGATGTFTANNTLGTTTITATDSDGDVVSASITVIANANAVTIDPVAAAFSNVGELQAFTPTGVGTSFSFALSGETGGYVITGAALTVAAFVATVTINTLPTAAEGDQNLTLTVTDGNGDTGTAGIFIKAAAT